MKVSKQKHFLVFSLSMMAAMRQLIFYPNITDPSLRGLITYNTVVLLKQGRWPWKATQLALKHHDLSDLTRKTFKTSRKSNRNLNYSAPQNAYDNRDNRRPPQSERNPPPRRAYNGYRGRGRGNNNRR